MAFKTAAAPAAEQPGAPAPVKHPQDPHVRGQVAMHAIIAGYRSAALLAPVLANSADKIREEFHKLAAEIAAKVEAYTFRD